jgi:nucleotidyltransferase substrate binding protein (TIGR01987 family)
MEVFEMSLELKSLKDAVVSFKSAVKVCNETSSKQGASSDMINTLRAGVIQNFEITYELCWKFMKRWIEANFPGESDADALSKKELFRVAAEHRLINDVEKWFEYHKNRNKTSHIYDGKTADIVFKSAVEFLKDAEGFLKILEAKND